ncbi:hypothetical protein S40288_10282 [Stachybotrys chartarum IBT 40288]|nr:hypothetical protein S40288_10282 [Stachybotrys chartarum IBT 40288]
MNSIQSSGPTVESSESTISIQIKNKTQAQNEGLERNVPSLSRQSTTNSPPERIRDSQSHSESFCHTDQSNQSNTSSGTGLEAFASNDDNGDYSTTGRRQEQSLGHTNPPREASLEETSRLHDEPSDIVQDLVGATSPSRDDSMRDHGFSLDEAEDTGNNEEAWLETSQLSAQLPHDQSTDRHGPPPAKRRRKARPPKERTTEYLDLTKANNNFNDQDNRQMERLVTALRKKKKIVVIAGAGISVSAGIPDFRSSTGLFATARTQHKLKVSGEQLFDASLYNHNETTESFHTMIREIAKITENAKPTPFHHFLASLAQEGRLMRLYSQNIDCIDTKMKPLSTNVPLNAKGPWPATIQLHGSLQYMVCTKCGSLKLFEAELFVGPQTPLCEDCVLDDEIRTGLGKRSHGIGRLRPRLVLYNEYNPDGEAIGMVSSADLKTCPDAVVVVGTSLRVPGTRRLVKELCQATRSRNNGFTAWINIDLEPKGAEFKDCWDLVVRAKCDDIARLVALPPWDCNIDDDYLVAKDSDSNANTFCGTQQA